MKRKHVLFSVSAAFVSFGLFSTAQLAYGQMQGSKLEESRRLVDISQSPCCRTIELIDQHGELRTLENLSGNVVIVMFGFTHCPNVCPTTLYELSAGLAGKDFKDQVNLVFVTLDPARDTESVLRNYITAFEPALALRGTDDEIRSTANEFRVMYWRVSLDDEAHYTVDHTAGIHVIDKKGNPAWYVPYGGINNYFWSAIESLARQ